MMMIMSIEDFGDDDGGDDGGDDDNGDGASLVAISPGTRQEVQMMMIIDDRNNDDAGFNDNSNVHDNNKNYDDECTSYLAVCGQDQEPPQTGWEDTVECGTSLSLPLVFSSSLLLYFCFIFSLPLSPPLSPSLSLILLRSIVACGTNLSFFAGRALWPLFYILLSFYCAGRA
jgi:hypothetical protein